MRVQSLTFGKHSSACTAREAYRRQKNDLPPAPRPCFSALKGPDLIQGSRVATQGAGCSKHDDGRGAHIHGRPCCQELLDGVHVATVARRQQRLGAWRGPARRCAPSWSGFRI